MVFLVVSFIYPFIPGLLGHYVKGDAESGRLQSLDYLFAYIVIPLLCLAFIWAGVGVWRCSWHALRRPWTVQNSAGKGTAMFALLMSLGLIGEGVIMPMVTLSDVMTPPPHAQHALHKPSHGRR
jgi:hypothetical protein